MKTKDKIEKVLIIGGGSAGYFSALYLKKYLQAEVHLVESPDIPTVGAGEASIPNMLDFLKELQIDEETFLKRTHGTFKMGIEYHYWLSEESKQPIYHPFYSSIDTHPFLVEGYYTQKAKGLSSSLAMECYPFIKKLHEKKAPRSSLGAQYQWQLPYAYHFDNHKLAAYLKELALERGILHLEDTITEVKLNKKGAIEKLMTQKHKELEADFYIDCSGFKGHLIQKALKSPVKDLKDYIFTDCALAVKLPYEDVEKQRLPYTLVRGMKAGWMWQIPLYEEIGYGYVHSKKYIEPSQALDELASYLPLDKAKKDPVFIPMKNFYLKKMWIKNCLAIGLSAGFIEPLESTGLFFITQALDTLRSTLPTLSLMEKQAFSFNQKMETLYEQVLAFICLHYQYAPRNDSSFWKDQKLKAKPHELLQKYHQHFLKRYGRIEIDEGNSPFHQFSYALFFDSFNLLPEAINPYCNYPKWHSYQKQLKKLQEKRLFEADKLPSQESLLAQLHKIPIA